MCKQLAVSRAGYYKWLHHEPSSVEEENEQIAVWIKEYNETYKSTLGYRRMHDYINRDKGKIYSKGRIHRIMQVHGIKSVIRKKKKLTYALQRKLLLKIYYTEILKQLGRMKNRVQM
jgi:hypothetical protein